MNALPSVAPDPELRGHYAGFVSRAIAFIIDLLVMLTIQSVYVFLVRLIFNFLGFSSIQETLEQRNQEQIVRPIITLITWTIALLSSITFFGLYAAICWTLIDRTIGQAFIGLRVLRPNGESLSFWRAIKRAIGYLLAIIPLFLGFFWILVDDRRQGWHDKLADTVVVYDWNARLGPKVAKWLREHQRTRALPVAAPAATQLTSEEPHE
jgi:uncharacterized RDD family membrane protein YckC